MVCVQGMSTRRPNHLMVRLEEAAGEEEHAAARGRGREVGRARG